MAHGWHGSDSISIESGCQYGGGYLVNFNDIGGKYSGVVYGIAHTIGGAAAVILPSLIGILTPNVNFVV